MTGASRTGVARALTAFAVSLLVSCLLAEVAVRLLSRERLRLLDVEMWRYAKLIKAESDAPGLVEEQRPNAEALLMGVRVRTDGRGLRRPDPATEARRRRGDRTVVALGDSLTFGWGVPEGETWADQLERLLAAQCPRAGGRRATVLNAGIGNSNTSMEAARYRLLLRGLHPGWLILGYFINDAEPDPVPSHNPLIRSSALAGLLSTRFLEGSDRRLHDYRRYYRGLYQDGQPGWGRTKAALAELGATLRADGTPATLILLPELHEPRGFGGFAGVYARVAALARADGFEVIDPSGAFPPGPGDAFWVSREDAHPDAAAQALFARALARSRYACPGEDRPPLSVAAVARAPE
jgi:lysophospholipase L1-like esterase